MRTLFIFVSLSTLVACSAAHPGAAPASDDKADNASSAPVPTSWAKATDTDLTKGTLSWKCKDPGNPNNTLELVHAHLAITTETIGGYLVVKDGKQVADQSTASMVFNIDAGPLMFHAGGQQIELTASLQDYSDIMSWRVFLQADATDLPDTVFSGVMLSIYQSSDGDDLLHPDQALLTCDVMIGK
jgi:hypothetical protein